MPRDSAESLFHAPAHPVRSPACSSSRTLRMTLEITLAYLHFLALIGTASLLVTEMVLCRPGITGDALQRLKKVDGAYGAFAGLTLATGALRLFFGAKGSHYYLTNPIFHTKFGLFVLVGLLSILP